MWYFPARIHLSPVQDSNTGREKYSRLSTSPSGDPVDINNIVIIYCTESNPNSFDGVINGSEPRLNDYVSWRNVEGWVYFVTDEYLTIEISVKPKEDDLVPMHRKHHCLGCLLFSLLG